MFCLVAAGHRLDMRRTVVQRPKETSSAHFAIKPLDPFKKNNSCHHRLHVCTGYAADIVTINVFKTSYI